MPTTSATMANFSTLATTTAGGGVPPPLTTMASLEGGYMTDSSIGNNHPGGPTITISQPNGKRGIVLVLDIQTSIVRHTYA